MVLVGPNPNNKRWKKLSQHYNGRLKVLGIIKRDECDNLYSIANCYVDSFPMDSMTSTINSVMNGVPSYSLRLPEAYCDELMKIKVNTIDDMNIYINQTLFQDKYITDILQLQKKIKATHCIPGWNENFTNIINKPEGNLQICPKTFEINDYYEYIVLNYLGLGITIKRADIRMLSFTNLMKVFKVLHIKLILSIIMRILKR